MNGKRILGIDYGKVRIGLALADPSLTIASPIGYIFNKGNKKNLAPFDALIRKHEVGTAVVGLPLNADGSMSTMAAEVQKFGDWLREQFHLEIIYYDERYTSHEAEELLREKLGIKNPKKIAETVDSLAASMILDGWFKFNSDKKTENRRK